MTQEEARMASAEMLRITRSIDGRVISVNDAVNGNVISVDNAMSIVKGVHVGKEDQSDHVKRSLSLYHLLHIPRLRPIHRIPARRTFTMAFAIRSVHQS